MQTVTFIVSGVRIETEEHVPLAPNSQMTVVHLQNAVSTLIEEILEIALQLTAAVLIDQVCEDVGVDVDFDYVRADGEYGR